MNARLTRIAAVSAALGLLAAYPAAAQVTVAGSEVGVSPGRFSVFGVVGYNRQWDDESRLGESAAFGGGVALRITRRLSVEGVLYRLGHRRDFTFYTVTSDASEWLVATPTPATWTGTATYPLAQLRYRFSTSRFQPHVAGGIGLMHYSGSVQGAVYPSSSGFSVTALAMSGTGGLDLGVTRRMTLGPYVGLLLSRTQETGTKMAMHLGLRVGVGL